jgi:hypothetical protein
MIMKQIAVFAFILAIGMSISGCTQLFNKSLYKEKWDAESKNKVSSVSPIPFFVFYETDSLNSVLKRERDKEIKIYTTTGAFDDASDFLVVDNKLVFKRGNSIGELSLDSVYSIKIYEDSRFTSIMKSGLLVSLLPLTFGAILIPVEIVRNNGKAGDVALAIGALSVVGFALGAVFLGNLRQENFSEEIIIWNQINQDLWNQRHQEFWNEINQTKNK